VPPWDQCTGRTVTPKRRTVTVSDPVEEALLASSFRLGRFRMRLLAQPQVQREWRKLARQLVADPEGYRPACEHFSGKLRGFYTPEEIDQKVKRLADPDYPDAWVWGAVPVREVAKPTLEDRQRRPRQTGASFRHYIDKSRDLWVDERIESAARHIAAGLDPRAVADGRHKPSGDAPRKQISRLRALLPPEL
jgi:hypothetical protein